jgi:hypothetical protein
MHHGHSPTDFNYVNGLDPAYIQITQKNYDDGQRPKKEEYLKNSYEIFQRNTGTARFR